MTNPASSVLVVEDNAQNRMLITDLLEASGYAVLQANTGMDAWALAQEHAPDLILMDVQLPDVSGLEVVAWLKSDQALKEIPVIAVTAFAMKGDQEKFLENGCDEYVSKPISVPAFLETVKRCLDGGAGQESARPATGLG